MPAQMPDEPPIEPPKIRTNHRKITEADKAKLRELFTREDLRVDGNIHIGTLSRLTGLTYNQISYVMSKDGYLRSQKGAVNPEKAMPTESDLINPPPNEPPPGVLLSPEDFAKYQAILRQQRKMMKRDWEGLGMSEEMATRMEKNALIGAAPLLPTIQMLYGGLIKHVGFLDEVLEGDAARIKSNMLPPEVDGEGNPVEDGKIQREWRYVWYAGYKLHLEIFNSMQKTQAMLARIASDMKNLSAGAKAPEKGIFQEVVVSERKPDAA